MKKAIPFVLVFVGIIVFAAVYFLVIRKPEVVNENNDEDTSALIEVPLEDRPVAILTPRSDGHWLDMEIDKLGRFEAASMDYELLYKTKEGVTQGVPGNIKLNGQESIERELLLGSESSGKFRYDEGVEDGTFSLKFRNDKGKLIAKFTTDFHLQSDTDTVISSDESFSFTLNKKSNNYFVVMNTFGLPDGYTGNVSMGPLGVFSSREVEGEINLEQMNQVWTSGNWQAVDGITPTGIFIASN